VADIEKKEIALLKWKRNPTFFVSLLYQQQVANITPWLDDIILGDQFAPLQIMVACNPYCRPCATVHTQLDHLLDNYPGNFGITIRFCNRC